MSGKIEDGQLVTVEPIKPDKLNIGDIVLVKVKGKVYLHLITAINDKQVQIGNNKGHINGWTPKVKVYGKVTKIEK